ncbi:MAG TPA: choice-of-anchor L domain-containing protein, partial [Solirubrobacteraceae bacterium]|nr:choice-of-anchor L domain-containing protein [Solirubrobacteraceae bacterium]
MSVAVGAGAAAARAAIIEYPADPSATAIARAIAVDPKVVKRAVFPAVPPGSKPAAVSTTRLAGFPLHGKSFGMLTTGNARLADDPNDAGDSGSTAGGPSIRGARDVTMMRIDLRIPRNANCLSFRFRFLSEEFPEFVDDVFNDAFIAEVNASNWTASTKEDPQITAPRNFAVTAGDAPIRINRIGPTSVSAAAAKGTTYDGATRILRASARVNRATRHLYLSIFDQGDRIYDSAVFIDKLIVGKRSRCVNGV